MILEFDKWWNDENSTAGEISEDDEDSARVAWNACEAESRAEIERLKKPMECGHPGACQETFTYTGEMYLDNPGKGKAVMKASKCIVCADIITLREREKGFVDQLKTDITTMSKAEERIQYLEAILYAVRGCAGTCAKCKALIAETDAQGRSTANAARAALAATEPGDVRGGQS